MLLAYIDGPSGSGKSMLCMNLRKKQHMICYDNDDIYSKHFLKVFATYKKEDATLWKKVETLAMKEITDIYNKYKNTNKFIVFVGSQKMPKIIYDNINYIYIIKVPLDIKHYKYRICRDFEKIATYLPKIKSYSKKHAQYIISIINHGFMINLSLPDYSSWKQELQTYYQKVKRNMKINTTHTLKNIEKKLTELSKS
jgi:adenylate kinase family enzyme